MSSSSASPSPALSPHPTLHHLEEQRRPLAWLRPTRQVWHVDHHGQDRRAEFNSRDARKGRYPLQKHHHKTIPHTHTNPIELRVKYRDQHHFKPHLDADISFWVAQLFWWGSAVWVANGFTVWLPVVRPETDSAHIGAAASALAFVGGSLFEVGAYLGLLEAGNRGMETDFGDAVEAELFGSSPHALNKQGSSHSISSGGGDVEKQDPRPKPVWSWAPKMRLHELGYLAALVQMFAATIFWVSTLTGLPGVIPGFSSGEGSVPIIDVFFWTPQVIGGSGFVISSLLIMFEVQSKWWKIAPFSIGWQVGVWNLVGSFGFLLCGALGYATSSKAIYESDLSTYWGSWGFLIGSTFQLYEAVWRVPSDDK